MEGLVTRLLRGERDDLGAEDSAVDVDALGGLESPRGGIPEAGHLLGGDRLIHEIAERVEDSTTNDRDHRQDDDRIAHRCEELANSITEGRATDLDEFDLFHAALAEPLPPELANAFIAERGLAPLALGVRCSVRMEIAPIARVRVCLEHGREPRSAAITMAILAKVAAGAQFPAPVGRE